MNTDIEILKDNDISGFSEKMLEKRKSDLKQILDNSHRLEVVAEIDGVEYVNDAKSSDLESTAYALDLISKPIVWILESGEYVRTFADLDKLILDGVQSIIVIGQNRSTTVEELMLLTDLVAEASNMEEAISLAKEMAHKGSCVLYSPAMPNNNKFGNYLSRGEAFKTALGI
ncbi:MAG: hypothetical protein HKN39_03165 [Flavobacteriales bacterium]|nr:hypothetical protein [Flavobacteriales bacterium]